MKTIEVFIANGRYDNMEPLTSGSHSDKTDKRALLRFPCFRENNENPN